MGIEHAIGAFILGNIGLLWKIVAEARKSAAREASQTGRLDVLERDVRVLRERHTEAYTRIFSKLEALSDDMVALRSDLAALRGELRGRGHVNGEVARRSL